MIYFDNAATTMMKPPQVAEAVARAIGTFGGVGRGVHEAALGADMTVYRARMQVARLLGGPDAKRVAFGLNVTEALNIVLCGMLHAGDHAITTAASHNSVLRPLYRKRDEEGVQLSILPVAPDASIDYDAFDALFRPETKLACVTHASNLTGDIYDIARMARIAHAHGALLVVDAAQTAGIVPIDMAADHLDIVAFTGHKSLYGPQGTGGLCVADGIDIPAFKVGGSGTHSYDERHPDFMPEHLEAGTMNAHGIAGAFRGACLYRANGHRCHCPCDRRSCRKVRSGRAEDSRCDGIRRPWRHRPLRHRRSECGAGGFGRGGRCAQCGLRHLHARRRPLRTAHARGYGHGASGAVRFSFSHFNTADEVDQGIAALAHIAADLQE